MHEDVHIWSMRICLAAYDEHEYVICSVQTEMCLFTCLYGGLLWAAAQIL